MLWITVLLKHPIAHQLVMSGLTYEHLPPGFLNIWWNSFFLLPVQYFLLPSAATQPKV